MAALTVLSRTFETKMSQLKREVNGEGCLDERRKVSGSGRLRSESHLILSLLIRSCSAYPGGDGTGMGARHFHTTTYLAQLST